ncbi:carboxyltransferase domain-containing protein [Glutamicibacter sp.]|uniref:5-oxoprolinase subunit B/C family protein n=1 Tax=Glutamicibacter sp. TaxID=1931995 RepID=UPI0028BF39FF|nr:carboxyltransferase domain-containing protein [Glutamicibacter sp.]
MSITAIHRAGSHDLLVDLATLDDVLALNSALDTAPLAGQKDILAAALTVLIKFDSAAHAVRAASLLPSLELGAAARNTGKLVEVPVHYDGEDLTAVAELTGMSVEAVVNAHTSQRWTAAFGGFAPGFAYLRGENQLLNVPRRSTPRTKVPALSVALAGEYSAVYPRQSPGGWQLIGHTDVPMWDLSRSTPALIRPQDTVQFTVATQAISVASPRAEDESPRAASTAPGLQIINPGLQTLIQDAGRPGYGNLGVGVAGTADQASYHQANALVGNPPGAAALEVLTGLLSLQAIGDQVVAVAGAEVELWITPAENDEVRAPRQAAANAPFALLDGERLDMTGTGRGLRSYLAVRGELDVPETLGSRSTDTLSGLGPAALAAGQRLGVTQPHHGHIVGNPQPSTLPEPDGDGVYTLRVIPGPRENWFGERGIQALSSQLWQVTNESNRVGIRLATDGSPLQRSIHEELPSEGVPLGALQVPPSGLPVLFLADHPVTGGYPVIATVIEEDLSFAAQLPAGSTIRFSTVESRGTK